MAAERGNEEATRQMNLSINQLKFEAGDKCLNQIGCKDTADSLKTFLENCSLAKTYTRLPADRNFYDWPYMMQKETIIEKLFECLTLKEEKSELTPENLYALLGKKGPLLVKAPIGIDSYKKDTEFQLTTIANAAIFAWKKSDYIEEAESELHATIIVGVKNDKEKPEQSRIFFLDPLQTLDPNQPYRIYSVNFSKYISKIKNIYSLSGYALTKQDVRTLEKQPPIVVPLEEKGFFASPSKPPVQNPLYPAELAKKTGPRPCS